MGLRVCMCVCFDVEDLISRTVNQERWVGLSVCVCVRAPARAYVH